MENILMKNQLSILIMPVNVGEKIKFLMKMEHLAIDSINDNIYSRFHLIKENHLSIKIY